MEVRQQRHVQGTDDETQKTAKVDKVTEDKVYSESEGEAGRDGNKTLGTV